MLPGSLSEAITALESSQLMAEVLGDHVFEMFVRNKSPSGPITRRR